MVSTVSFTLDSFDTATPVDSLRSALISECAQLAAAAQRQVVLLAIGQPYSYTLPGPRSLDAAPSSPLRSFARSLKAVASVDVRVGFVPESAFLVPPVDSRISSQLASVFDGALRDRSPGSPASQSATLSSSSPGSIASGSAVVCQDTGDGAISGCPASPSSPQQSSVLPWIQQGLVIDVVALAGAALIVLAALMCAYRWRRKRGATKDSSSRQPGLELQGVMGLSDLAAAPLDPRRVSSWHSPGSQAEADSLSPMHVRIGSSAVELNPIQYDMIKNRESTKYYMNEREQGQGQGQGYGYGCGSQSQF